jgi:hypothetical protein
LNWWPQRVKDYSGSLEKTHGKRKMFKSARGWGHYVGDQWMPAKEELEMTDEHVSVWYVRNTIDRKKGNEM